jgi:hypothetical protein
MVTIIKLNIDGLGCDLCEKLAEITGLLPCFVVLDAVEPAPPSHRCAWRTGNKHQWPAGLLVCPELGNVARIGEIQSDNYVVVLGSWHTSSNTNHDNLSLSAEELNDGVSPAALHEVVELRVPGVETGNVVNV